MLAHVVTVIVAMNAEDRREHLTMMALSHVLMRRDFYRFIGVNENHSAALRALDRHFGSTSRNIRCVTQIEDSKYHVQHSGLPRSVESRSLSRQPHRRAGRKRRAKRPRLALVEQHAGQKKPLPRPIPLKINWPRERDGQAATIEGYDKQRKWSTASWPTERDRQAATIKGYRKQINPDQPASTRSSQLARKRASGLEGRRGISWSDGRRGFSWFPKGGEEMQEMSDDDKDCVAGGLQLNILDSHW